MLETVLVALVIPLVIMSATPFIEKINEKIKSTTSKSFLSLNEIDELKKITPTEWHSAYDLAFAKHLSVYIDSSLKNDSRFKEFFKINIFSKITLTFQIIFLLVVAIFYSGILGDFTSNLGVVALLIIFCAIIIFLSIKELMQTFGLKWLNKKADKTNRWTAEFITPSGKIVTEDTPFGMLRNVNRERKTPYGPWSPFFDIGVIKGKDVEIYRSTSHGSQEGSDPTSENNIREAEYKYIFKRKVTEYEKYWLRNISSYGRSNKIPYLPQNRYNTHSTSEYLVIPESKMEEMLERTIISDS